VPAPFFLNSALRFVAMREYVAGLLKTPFFGAIVALIGCHYGLITEGGTAGVGRSTTRTVVAISITILIADLFLTKVAILLRPIF
jgi:phospholipid/cholesterol/gamma-HCH transport system permease protein